MDTGELFERLSLALAIGLFVGVERGWRERDGLPGSRTAGIRTYALIGLFGGVMGALVPTAGPWPLAAGAVGFAAAFAAFQWRESVARQDFSITGVIAGLLVFGLGAYAVIGNMAAAGAAGVATTVLLASRQYLHGMLRRMTWPELRSAVLLLAMTFLFLPILPDRTVDPWGALNPYDLWVLVVLIAVLSFAGYVAVRVMGTRRGLAAASAAGALVSSTAVTLNNARWAARASTGSPTLAGAICIAWMVSLLRMGAIAVTVNIALLWPLSIPLGIAVLVLGIAALVFYAQSRASPKDGELALSNPFDLGAVLAFGALLAVVMLAAKLASGSIGGVGLLGLAAVSGLIDVDPITLSAARLAGGSVTVGEAALAILLAASANLATKTTTAVVVGGVRFGLPLAFSGVLAVAAGGVAWALVTARLTP